MKKLLTLSLVVCCLLSFSLAPTLAQEEEFQDGGPGDCIASWDPFCPQGTPWEESDPAPGTGGPEDCYTCETGYIAGLGNAQVCVSAGSTGRTVCDDGLLYSYCDLSGAFCDSVTVTP